MNDGLMNSCGTRAVEDCQRLPLVGRLLRGRYAFTAVTLATAALGGAVGGASGGLPELLLGATGGLLAQLSSRVVEAMVETGKVRRGDWAASGDDPGAVAVEAAAQAVDRLLPRGDLGVVRRAGRQPRRVRPQHERHQPAQALR